MDGIVWALYGLMAATLAVLATALFAAISRIDGLRSEFRAEFIELRSEFRGECGEIRSDIREVRGAVADLDRRLTTAGG